MVHFSRASYVANAETTVMLSLESFVILRSNRTVTPLSANHSFSEYFNLSFATLALVHLTYV